jgi:tRNA pseudouridine55 synthase
VPAGLVLIDKPAAITSHDVVAKLRRSLNTRKIGHAGTLDPAATGLMLCGVGSATRLLTYLSGLDKTYLAKIQLGWATATDDAEGERVDWRQQSHSAMVQPADNATLAGLSEAEIDGAIALFRGKISQLPTSVSALKIDGRRAYDLVRAGETVELAERELEIARFERVSEIVKTAEHIEFDAVVDCSSGTYIRALARDLGVLLGVGGHLAALRRTRIGGFEIAQASSIESPKLIDPGVAARQVFEVIEADAELELALRHGKKPESTGPNGQFAVLSTEAELIAIVDRSNNQLRSSTVFARESDA